MCGFGTLALLPTEPSAFGRVQYGVHHSAVGQDSVPVASPDRDGILSYAAAESRTVMTLEPDGQATGCNPVEVGSTPTGVSLARPPITSRARPGTAKSCVGFGDFVG